MRVVFRIITPSVQTQLAAIGFSVATECFFSSFLPLLHWLATCDSARKHCILLPRIRSAGAQSKADKYAYRFPWWPASGHPALRITPYIMAINLVRIQSDCYGRPEDRGAERAEGTMEFYLHNNYDNVRCAGIGVPHRLSQQ